MKHLAIIIMIIFLSGCAGKHFEPFSKKDLSYQMGYTALAVADWGQTLDFKNHATIEERNFVLGSNPSDDKINILVPLAIAGVWVFVWWLPKENRRSVQSFFIGAEGACVLGNDQLGAEIY